MLSENEIQTKVNFLSSARCNHTFHKYIDITGDLIEGTLLSRILYWFAPSKDNKSKVKIYKDGECWIATISNMKDNTDYKMLVDEYFNTKFSTQCDYSLVHFSSEKVLIIIVGVAGGVLGIVGMFVIPGYPANNILDAIAVGIVSGMASTGVNQIYKQIKKNA